MMRTEHVIYLSSAGCALWSWRSTAFAESPVRTAAGEDPAAVVEELCQLNPGPVAVLVDMIDEEHARDVVARLGHRDQQVLLERKLARRYPRTVFRTAHGQGRSAENRDEDRVLLSALTRPEPLRVLLQGLASARLPVVGVFSPALLTERLLDARSRSAPAVMLVLRRRNGRLQHSMFLDGRLAGSRRLRGAADAGREDASVMLRQIEESLRYFDPTFEISANRPLQVVLAPADLALMRSAETRGEGWDFREFDVAGVRQRLRLRAPLEATESERVFIQLLRVHAGSGNFAPPAERRYFNFFQIRNYGKVACIVVAGLALAGTLRNTLYIVDARQQLAEVTSNVQRLESVLPASRDAISAGIDPVEMQQVVTAYEALERQQAPPQTILATIGTAVSQRPRIQVDGVEWALGGSQADDAVAQPDALAAEDTGEAGEEAVAAEMLAADRIRVTLRGHVRPFDGDYPLAFDELAALVAALREDPDVTTVTTRVQPLDVSPASTLIGELANGGAEVEAPFTLEIIMRLGHEPA